MFKRYSYLRWFLYLIIFGLWSVWLIHQRVGDFERFVVNNCLTEIRTERSAALILGAGLKNDGEPDLLFADRLEMGASLYQAGLVKKLIVSGSVNRLAQDEAKVGKNYLLSLGIAPQDIFVDSFGSNTYHSIFRAKNVFGLDSLLIVSQGFHLPRALYLGRRLGLDAWGCRADKNYYPQHKEIDKRERLSKIKAWLDINIGVEPRLSGAMINIDDDGRQTWEAY
jgi:SanA protein